MNEEFVWVVMGCFLALVASVWIYGYYYMNIKEETLSDTLKNIKDVFWTNTAMGWMWNVLFGKKKAKQAPPHFTNQFGHQIPIIVPSPTHLTAKKAAPKGFLTIPTPPPISSYNTSSLNRVGKPLVIKNWDRLAGMAIPMLVNMNLGGHNWIVTQAGESRDGYSCMFENRGGFGNSNRAVSLTVYSDMYDSHRVLVKCNGRISTMDVEAFKDPNNMLYRIANEFQEKFR
jgi:hypothetical protein